MSRWKPPRRQPAGQLLLGFEAIATTTPKLPATVPGRSETSRAAAESAEAAASTQLEFVFSLIAGKGDYGATIDEIDAATGFGQSSICPRVKRLEESQRITATEKTRLTRKGRAAKVWRATR